MGKKLLFLALATAVLAFGACKWEIPETVVIKANPKLDLPVDKDSVNLSELLFTGIRDAIGDMEGFTILDYLGYKVNKKEVQTFLMNYSIEPQDVGGDFNFEDQLKLVDDLTFDDMDEFNFDIGDKDLNAFEDMDIDPIEMTFGLGSLFYDIETRINNNFGSNTTSNLLATDFPIVGGGTTVTAPFLNWGNDISFTAIMDEADFYEGELVVEIKIEAPTAGVNALSGANVTFDNIAIVGKSGDIIGHEGSLAGLTSVTLNGSSPASSSKKLYFNLQNQTVGGTFSMTIGSYTDSSTSVGAVKLVLHPEAVDDLKFREVKGLDLGDEKTEIDVTPDTFDLLNVDADLFVHAQVGIGTLSFNVDESIFEEDGYATNGFDFVGFDYNYTINIAQEDRVYTGDSKTYPGLGGLGGLTSYVTFTKDNTSLNGHHLVPGKDIHVLTGSKFFLIPEQGASFRIDDSIQGSGNINLDITPNLKVELFSEVHVDITDEIDKLAPEIPEVDLSDAATYLKWIHFIEVGPKITFGDVPVNGMQITVWEEHLNINYPVKTPQAITSGKVMKFTKEDYKLPLQGTEAIDKLEFKMTVTGGSGGGVISIPNVDPKDASLNFKMGDIDFISDWDEMEIDPGEFGKFDGTYPGDGPEDVIDLSSFGDFLNGFLFDNVEAYLYISGPKVFFDLNPDITVDMTYTKDGSPQTEHLLTSGENFQNAGALNLEGKETYSGDLPVNGKKLANLTNILKDLPEDLRFVYKVNLENKATIIEKDKLGDLSNSMEGAQLKLDILLVFPLILTAEKDGAGISISNIMKGDEETTEGPPEAPPERTDLLGRTPGEESPFKDVKIKSLNLRLVLTDSVFSGGDFYLDDTQTNPGGRKIKIPLKGKELGLNIKGDDLDYIGSTEIWDPEIGVEFTKGATISLPRNLGVSRIKVNAKIEYQLDLAEEDEDNGGDE